MKPVIQLALLIILFIFSILFNIGLIDIRFEEIDFLLGKAAFDKHASNTLGIVARYELIKRRIQYGEEDESNYELEARIQALTSGDQFAQPENRLLKKYLVPFRLFLNGIRFSLGKELITPEADSKIVKVLEIAYFWERNRKYKEAIKIYSEILSLDELSENIRATVMIHKAFCHSMLSEYSQAKTTFEKIISLYPDTDSGVLAWKLLEFIETIEEKRATVQKNNRSIIEKAKQYYLLMDYRNSIKYYSLFLQKNRNSPSAAMARYFKGRSHEELGEVEEAVIEYRMTIQIDKLKKWAREANRRMLMLGEFYDYRKKMAEEAKKQLAAYQDGSFYHKLDKFKGMVSSSSIREELLKNPSYSSKFASEDLLKSLDGLDLIGDQTDEKKRLEDMEKFRNNLINKGIKSDRELKELNRRKSLNTHPFRRPSYIKKFIDDNTNQLRYIYNQKLRKGVRLSGKMLVEIKIKANGTISQTKLINSNIGDSGFEEQILVKISEWQLASVPDTLGVLRIRYPFEFYEEQ